MNASTPTDKAKVSGHHMVDGRHARTQQAGRLLIRVVIWMPAIGTSVTGDMQRSVGSDRAGEDSYQ